MQNCRVLFIRNPLTESWLWATARPDSYDLDQNTGAYEVVRTKANSFKPEYNWFISSWYQSGKFLGPASAHKSSTFYFNGFVYL